MIKTSTPVTNLPAHDNFHPGNATDESLGEADQQFFQLLKKDLNEIATQPANSTIEKLLRYSRSLK
ncbi:hypothetical protein [Hufsiella ginkgonis]|uniref:Uncharacterized protein n=1 Tax=Hufsiella ginkgonis TaxID=2695274 RepID=A0A7K1Y589_9SPHI|nr:hypothetical protein [Hufsiella ginkgonis]MXV17977.1 hypothetical protein [Hufsiella ginkgonis]